MSVFVVKKNGLAVCLLLALSAGLNCAGADDLAVSVANLWPDPLVANPAALRNGQGGQGICPSSIDVNAPLTLGKAVDIALCNNAQIRAAWTEIKIETAGVGSARSAYLPTLNATYSPQVTKTQYPAFPAANTEVNGHADAINFAWRLFDFGARNHQLEAANQALVAAIAAHDAAIQKALLTLVGSYYDAFTNKAIYDARSEESRLAEQTLQATRNREHKGVAQLSDSLQAQTALAKAELEQQRALGDYRKSVSVMLYNMGVQNYALEVRFPDDLNAPQPELLGDLQLWLKSAEQNHPAIRQAEASYEAAREKATATALAGYPTVDLYYNYYQNGFPNQGLQSTGSNISMWGVTFTLPLFDGFANHYKVRAAEAQAEQSRIQLDDARQQVAAEVIKDYADAISALNNLQASRNLVDAAIASNQSSQRRYDHGAADILELINTQAALADARQERIRTLAEWQAARLKLLAAVGILDRSGL